MPRKEGPVVRDFLAVQAVKEEVGLKNRLYKAFIRRFASENSVPPHYHPELEIIVPVGVKGETRVSGRRYMLADSNAYVMPCHAVHSFRIGPAGKSEVLVLQINLEECLKLVRYYPGLDAARFRGSFAHATVVPATEATAIRDAVKRLSQLGKGPVTLRHALTDIECVHRIVRLVAQDAEPAARVPKGDDRVRRVIDIIEARAHEPVSLEAIARAGAVSKFHLCRLFKKTTGLTVQTYLNQLRVNRACVMLTNSKNVTETCFDCGFESVSYFIQVFRKMMGQTPKQWALSLSD
ncbi:MAG: AraC family transcriptional regulator [Fibrobacterota bacterium]